MPSGSAASSAPISNTGSAISANPSSAAASESRRRSPRSPSRVNTSTSTGPLMLTEVVSVPAASPPPSSNTGRLPDGAGGGAGRRLAIAWATAAATTTTPTSSCSSSRSARSSSQAPATTPGTAATRIVATSRPATARRRRSVNRTRTLIAIASSTTRVTARSGERAANAAGATIRAKPKPIAAWTDIPTRTATTRITSSELTGP